MKTMMLCVGVISLPVIALAQEKPTGISTLNKGRIAAIFSPGIVMVQSNEDYYLPNNAPKFGFYVGGQYERFFGVNGKEGLRLSLLASFRNGQYIFANTDVQRQELFLTLPIEFVRRRPIGDKQDWWLTGAIGGYFSELAQRHTYTIDPVSSKTTRHRDDWIYGIGGFTASFGVGKQGKYEYSEFGIKFTADAGDYIHQSSNTGLPNLRCSTFNLYYSFSR